MKIEDIKNAALECALFEDYYYNPDLLPAYIDGFTRGAIWRIDSVWNEASNKPEAGRLSLAFCESIPIIRGPHYIDLGNKP